MPIPRPFRHVRIFRILLAIFIFYDLLQVLFIQRRLSFSVTAKPPPRNTRVYIASIHWNNEAILRAHWNSAVIKLVKALGPDNVFVSVYESGSWDDSKGALRDLGHELDKVGVPKNITVSEVTHHDEITQLPGGPGWIDTSRGRTELRRIPYLSRLRNYTLWNLEHFAKQGITFDKILFLNDVVFTVCAPLFDAFRVLTENT
jgi:mannosyltransferase 1 (CAP59)